MNAPAAALVVSARCFDLRFWSDDDTIVSAAQLPPLIALRDGRVALGKGAERWFALDQAELLLDLLGWMGGGPAPFRAPADNCPELWCAALMRQLREDAIANGFDLRQPCVLVLPDALVPQNERFRAAAAVAGLALDHCVPYSLAIAHAAPRRLGTTRLVCVADDLALTLALATTEEEQLTIMQSRLETGLGATARNEAVAKLIEGALLGEGIESSARRAARIRLAARSLHPRLFGDARRAIVEIDAGPSVRQICVSPTEVARLLSGARASCLRSLRELVSELPVGASPMLVAGEAHDVLWVRRLMGEAIPSATFETVRSDDLAKGALKVRRALSAPTTSHQAAAAPALVGLLDESASGILRFDVLFDTRDTRDRATLRRISFPDEARIALHMPAGDGRFQRLGEVHFPVFDYVRGDFDVRFARTDSRTYQIQCFERATGRVENRTLTIADVTQDKALVAALAALKIVPPLPAGWA